MALALLVIPLVVALVALAIPSDRVRPYVLPCAGAAHLAMTVRALGATDVSALDNLLQLDPTSKVVLALLSTLFFLCSLYVPGYVRSDSHGSNRTFCASLLA